ncbi:MAG: glycoside hydrolase family 43 protein [Turicibacter sp.]|nr:glycoside hydrolase family 43 protein [Turicibacter sp.]
MNIQNPILKGFNPDPCICRVGEDYYIATSTFEWFPGVQIHHSKDLKNWRLVSRPLNRISQLNMHGNPNSGGVWAPALSYADGKFWLIYSDMKVVSGAWKDGHNYLVTCDTVDGEWSDPVFLNSSGFDPSLYHDEGGKKYLLNMVWDQRVHQHSFHGIVLQEYAVDEQKLIGKPQIIFRGTEAKLTEAPHIYKVGDYYYLLTAEGGTTYAHVATIARSKQLAGPYEVHPENPLITTKHEADNPLQKAGHASMVHTHTDEWYLTHLMGRPIKGDGNSANAEGRNTAITETERELMNRGYCPLGRESSIQKLEWRDGWPYVVGGNAPSLLVDGLKMTEVPWEQNYLTKDDFDQEGLNIHFQTLRIPLESDVLTLAERPGYLRLYGRESLISHFTQALVARRWQSLNFEAETKVAFAPETFQQMAGLTCYYNTMNWTSLHVTWHEEKGRVVDLMTAENGRFDQPIVGKEIVVPEGVYNVYLKVKVEVETYTYFYSFDGEEWNEVAIKLDSYKLSDDFVAGGGFFTGAFVGIHCQDTSGARLPADFDYFRYEEL